MAIVVCTVLMCVPGPAHAATLAAFDGPGVSVNIESVYPAYVVRSGDTLTGIARKYDLPWQGVWCANYKVIGSDPDILRIGELLVMKSASCSAYQGYANASNTIAASEYNTTGTPQHIAWVLLASYGGNRPVQYACLNYIIMAESSWRVEAENASGAYGIPQALPGYKMGPGWEYSAYVQLHWMVKEYIPAVYGTPCHAWSFHLAHGYY